MEFNVRSIVESVKQFLREVKTELKKVTWPTRKDTMAGTAVVLVTVVLLRSSSSASIICCRGSSDGFWERPQSNPYGERSVKEWWSTHGTAVVCHPYLFGF